MMEDIARRPDAEQYMKKLKNVYFSGGESHFHAFHVDKTHSGVNGGAPATSPSILFV